MTTPMPLTWEQKTYSSAESSCIPENGDRKEAGGEGIMFSLSTVLMGILFLK